ncbi:MAG: ankyrin repeat domain-containing protein [Acetatifactor sp.]|nr:ankyrin repeat domain-containing protein [Acetatifactor sp.]
MKKRLLLLIVVMCIVGGTTLAIFFNSDYYYAKKLVYAIGSEDITTIEQILKKKPSCVSKYPQVLPEKIFNTICEDRGTTYPLIEACRNDNVEIVKALLEAGADPNCSAGFTPLSVTYMCKEENWYSISLLLIEYGASLDYVTEISGGTSAILMDIVRVRSGGALPGYVPESETEVSAAFYYAIESCDHSKVNWMWVLQESVSCDRIEIVKFLLDKNYCDVNDTSRDMTALMFAARDSTIEMTQLLLDRGADKNFVDSTGKTAYDYAVENGNTDIAFLLAN